MSATYKFTLLLAAFALTACTTMAPGADRVNVAKSADAVAGCKMLGNVQTANSGVNTVSDLKNKAVVMGADTILVTNRYGWVAQGVVYKCQ